MSMTKPVDNVEDQWEVWQKSNDAKVTANPTDEQLRELIIKDLTYVSQMDVKEYILYQKWCEIKEKYPTTGNPYDDEILLLDNSKLPLIKEVKSNIWMPNGEEDYMNLKPCLEFTDDAGVVEVKGLDIEPTKNNVKRSNLPEKWNTARNFISTMKNNSNIGRNLNFLAKDEATGKYLGTICISSDFLDLTPRDKAIGWDRKRKTQGGMINYTAIGSTIVPFQPLGYNYVGGKLLALLCLSDDVQRLWKEKYGDTLVGVTTTSLYGKSKPSGLSQYDGLEHWNAMGFSAGSVGFEPTRETINLIKQWLKKHHTRKYFEWWYAKKSSGQPYKRDHKNRSLAFVYSKLGIPKNIIKADHCRGIYFSPLYNNTFEFLREEIKADQLVKAFDTSNEALSNIWKEKYARPRIRQLMKQKKVSNEVLFYDDLIFLTWEETKQKYLGQVCR